MSTAADRPLYVGPPLELAGDVLLGQSITGSWWLECKRHGEVIGPYPTEGDARRFAGFLADARRADRARMMKARRRQRVPTLMDLSAVRELEP